MGNIMRVSGLASGMDTETTIKQLMDAEKIKLNKFNANKQIKIWSQEAYNNTNKDIASFIIDTKKELELMKTNSNGISIGNSSSNFSWLKKSTSRDTSIADVTATATALSGEHSINVQQIAKGVSLASSDNIVADAKGNDQIIKFNMTFKKNDGSKYDKQIEVKWEKDKTLSELASKINSVTSLDPDNKEAIVVNKLNASYDSGSKRFFLSTANQGKDAKINVTSDDGKVMSDILKLGISVGSPMQGQNAIIDFDGAKNIEYSNNNITINGLTISIKDKGSTTIKVDTDVDGAYNKIKGFIDKYNELIDKLDKKTSEKRYRDYQPLTEEQKKSMDKDTVKLWEDKAKSGLLKNDENINKIINNTRSGLYDSVYDSYDEKNIDSGKIGTGFKMLTEIGITTGTYQEKGKLKIDETKLKKALGENADGVMNLLFKTSDAPDGDPKRASERSKESGVITRIYDNLTSGMKNIIDKSGTGDNAPLYRQVKSTILIDFVTKNGSMSLLDKDVFNLEKQIKNENDRLDRKEKAYYNKFAALEKAMNKMNSQSSWLSSQLGGGK